MLSTARLRQSCTVRHWRIGFPRRSACARVGHRSLARLLREALLQARVLTTSPTRAEAPSRANTFSFQASHRSPRSNRRERSDAPLAPHLLHFTVVGVTALWSLLQHGDASELPTTVPSAAQHTLGPEAGCPHVSRASQHG
jgi:hypothetical protein